MNLSKDNEYCRKCGSMLDDSKKCPMCGKQYFNFKKIFIVIPLIIVSIVAIILSSVYVFIPQYKYEKAVKLANNHNFEEANIIFNELGDYRDSKTLIHNHYFSDVKEVAEPSCFKDGYKICECSCGETKKQTLSAHHSYKAATCTEPQICKVCNKTSGSPLGHTEDYAVCQRCDLLLFKKQTYSGYGPGYVKNITLPYGEYTIYGSHNGNRNFIVDFYTGHSTKFIANKIGKCSAVSTVVSSFINPIENGYIDVEMADGSWSFTIEAFND